MTDIDSSAAAGPVVGADDRDSDDADCDQLSSIRSIIGQIVAGDASDSNDENEGDGGAVMALDPGDLDGMFSDSDGDGDGGGGAVMALDPGDLDGMFSDSDGDGDGDGAVVFGHELRCGTDTCGRLFTQRAMAVSLCADPSQRLYSLDVPIRDSVVRLPAELPQPPASRLRQPTCC